jgi:hypothetical protein
VQRTDLVERMAGWLSQSRTLLLPEAPAARVMVGCAARTPAGARPRPAPGSTVLETAEGGMETTALAARVRAKAAISRPLGVAGSGSG